jgi:xanthine dehydrogenase large subunit
MDELTVNMDQKNTHQTKDPAVASARHLDSALHVTGQSRFVVDEPRPAGMLFVKLLPSPFARAGIISIDTSKAAALQGVAAVLTHRDIPGQNQIGHAYKDEPLFPSDETAFAGQPWRWWRPKPRRPPRKRSN